MDSPNNSSESRKRSPLSLAVPFAISVPRHFVTGRSSIFGKSREMPEGYNCTSSDMSDGSLARWSRPNSPNGSGPETPSPKMSWSGGIIRAFWPLIGQTRTGRLARPGTGRLDHHVAGGAIGKINDTEAGPVHPGDRPHCRQDHIRRRIDRQVRRKPCPRTDRSAGGRSAGAGRRAERERSVARRWTRCRRRIVTSFCSRWMAENPGKSRPLCRSPQTSCGSGSSVPSKRSLLRCHKPGVPGTLSVEPDPSELRDDTGRKCCRALCARPPERRGAGLVRGAFLRVRTVLGTGSPPAGCAGGRRRNSSARGRLATASP